MGDKISLKLIIAILIILVVAGFLAHFIGGIWFALITDVVFLIALFLLKLIVRPKPFFYLIVMTALVVFGQIVLGVVTGVDWVEVFVVMLNIFYENSINVDKVIINNNQLLVVGISGFIIALLVLLFKKQSIVPPINEGEINEQEEFKDADYKTLRNRFCEYMERELDELDKETNWSDNDYTVLEAEVELIGQYGKRSKIAKDLLKALKNDKISRSFLLIGEPGSGKSVSLRRLVRELYKESIKQGVGGVVPIYVNLKEWTGSSSPDDGEIIEFVKKHLKDISGRDVRRFIEKYFDKMLSAGLLFFVFDSFDEMPVVMNCDDHSQQIKKISKAFDVFFNDIHNCRGLLSSRPFRQPVGFRSRRLTIMPFNERQIRKAMDKWLIGERINASDTVRRLFVERPQFSSALRNPFMSNLIAYYIIKYPDRLPNNYYELFDVYIDSRFDDDKSKFEELNLEKDEIYETAIDIAQCIYTTPYVGLEVSLSFIKENIDNKKVVDILTALKYSRIIRWGGNSNDKLSFVHRRFAEFFAVCAILRNPKLIDYDAIPTDSRWRDSLVVYCGVAPIEKVKELSAFAWKVILSKKETINYSDYNELKPVVHCLRFLRDACQSRQESIEGFQNKLSDYVIEFMNKDDLLLTKIGVELLSIVNSSARVKGIEIAFEKGAAWIMDAAIRSCRHLAELEQESVKKIREYIINLSFKDVLKRYYELDFSFSLSDALKSTRTLNTVNLISLIALHCISILFIISNVYLYQTGMYAAIIFFVAMLIFQGAFAVRKTVKFIMRENSSGYREAFGYSIMAAIYMNLINLIVYKLPYDEGIGLNLVAYHWYTYVLIVLIFLLIMPIQIYVFVEKVIARQFKYMELFQKALSRIKYVINLFKERRLKILFIYTVPIISMLLLINYAGPLFDWLIRQQLFLYIVYAFCVIVMLNVIKNVYNAIAIIVHDYFLLRKININNEITVENMISSIKGYKTDYWTSRYIEIIRINKVKVIDCDSINDKIITNMLGKKSKIEYSRFKEQLYGFQE